MVSGDTREVVVIKNINSNIIEEAILILKTDTGTGEKDISMKGQGQLNKNGKDFILKEAQVIINSYIKEHGIHKKPLRGKGAAIKLFKRKILSGKIFGVVLVLGILLLILTLVSFLG